MATETIGIMAGSGQFPILVARSAKALGLRVVICGFYENTDEQLAAEADAFTMLHLGQLGSIIKFFKKNGADRVCMAGAIHKPRGVLQIKPDWRTLKLFAQLVKNRGDDAILRAVAGEMQSEGITIVRPDTLVPDLGSPTGVLSDTQPTQEIWQDIRFGWNIARQVGVLDIGQLVVVRHAAVMAVEAIEGTDAALARGGQLGGPGCTAVKVVKPGQDKRLDLPSIGLRTISLLAEHGFACMAFDATGALFFDRDAALDLARKHKIAVVAIPEDAEAFFAQYGV